MTNFEDLSDEIIISIIEYLSLEHFVSIFEQLNTRLACIILDHPWTQHRLNIQMIDDNTLEKKINYIENMKLVSRISSINIRPFSIYHSIETFNHQKSLKCFGNLKALSLNNITLEEVGFSYKTSLSWNFKFESFENRIVSDGYEVMTICQHIFFIRQ